MRCFVERSGTKYGWSDPRSVTAYTLLGDVKFLHFLFFFVHSRGRGGGRQSLWRKGAEGNKRGECPL